MFYRKLSCCGRMGPDGSEAKGFCNWIFEFVKKSDMLNGPIINVTSVLV